MYEDGEVLEATLIFAWLLRMTGFYQRTLWNAWVESSYHEAKDYFDKRLASAELQLRLKGTFKRSEKRDYWDGIGLVETSCEDVDVKRFKVTPLPRARAREDMSKDEV